MTDYVLKTSSAEVMYAAYTTVGIANEDGFQDVGVLPDGTSWSLLDFGPTAAEPGHLSVLRWNGDAPTPQLPADVEILWASDTDPYEAYPQGLPRFA